MGANNIADQIKMTLNGFDEHKMYHHMLDHYKVLQLIDEEGSWVLPSLQSLSAHLLPANVDESSSKAFVDEMAHLAGTNPYLVNFLAAAQNEKFDILSRKVNEEGATLFPDLVAFAMVLERLSVAMYNDLKLVIELIEYFKETREMPGVFGYRSSFHKVKLQSVERPFYRRSVLRLKTGSVSPTALRWSLPVNILEACVTDFLKGNRSNAKAGWPLIANKPGNAMDDPDTGAGPSRLSPDKKAVRLHMPLPKEWADLYQTWNMAFVVQFPFYLYLIPKLLIPQVAKYQDKPTEYIYNRILALYLVLNYSGFCLAIKQKNGEPDLNWSDAKLTRLWGKANLQSAAQYKSAVVSAKSGR